MTRERAGLWFDLVSWTLTAAVLYATRFQLELLTLEELGLIGLVVSIWTVGRTATRKPFGPLSATGIYLVLLCLFHFGLAVALALGVEPSLEIDQGTWRWLYTDQTARALILSLLGALGCAVGGTVAALLPRPQVPPIAVSERADFAMGQLGSGLTVLSVLAWAVILVRQGGLGVFTSSYMGMHEAVQGTLIAYVYVALHIGVPLMAATRWRWTHRWGWAAFGVYAVLALAMGIRGQVLMTFAATVPVFAMRGLRMRPWPLFLGALVLLTLASAIRDIRVVGLARISEVREISFNPADGLMELGSSIRPVTEVIKWHDQGDPLIYGASYWATIDRPVRKALPGLQTIPGDEDERIMNVLVMKRNAGAIGFSPIAEAFRNFGTAGVFAILWITGLLMGTLDKLPRVGAWPALVGVSLVPLLLQVRNSFVHVPAGVLFGVGTVLAIVTWFGSFPKERKRQHPEDRHRERPVA